MAKPTRQWACIAILALMGSTFTMAHMVMPPTRPAGSRELQMDKNGEPETSNLQASEPAGKTAQHHPSQMDKTEASASGCGGSREDKGIYGGGHGSGGTSIGFHNIYPFFGFPFGIFVPQVTTWGEGGGYGGGGSNNNPGMGVNCHCTHNEFPMHYVTAPVYFQPMGPASPNNMRRDGPGDQAPGPSHN